MTSCPDHGSSRSISSFGDDDDNVRVRVIVCGCQGKGGDPNSFRPQAHDKQWWGRRDALVRCVTSFLFGPSCESKSQSRSNNRELVLLFDEDRTRIHMSLAVVDGTHNKNRPSWTKSSNDQLVTPTEQNILKIWKRAAQPQNIGKQIQLHGIQCRVVIDPTVTTAMASDAPSSQRQPKSNRPSDLNRQLKKKNDGTNVALVGSKRQILEHIQRTCPLEFLKSKRLNASSDVILRKVNRDSLLKIWSEYQSEMVVSASPSPPSPSSSVKSSKSSTNQNITSNNAGGLRTIYNDLLALPDHLPKTSRVVAGLLHESCEEFPCFHLGEDTKSDETIEILRAEKQPLLLCLFLGAVRDMTTDENSLLKEVCKNNKQSPIPLVGIRFGKVPEFTSKVLSILAFHHSRNVMYRSINCLVMAQNDKNRKHPISVDDHTVELHKAEPTCLNVAVAVPMKSVEVSSELDRRDRLHWCLVRIIVCTLWRSRMVASSDLESTRRVSHANMLYLVFDDGVCISLSETTFVRRLASQHQAAPSEFQILQALVEEIKHQSDNNSIKANADLPTDDSTTWSRKKFAKRITKKIFDESPVSVTCTIGLTPTGGSEEIVNNFYNSESSNGQSIRHFGILLVIDMGCGFHSDGDNSGNERKKRSKMYRGIVSASENCNKLTLSQLIIPSPPCSDLEGASIMALQHFCYQNRVFHASKSQKNKRKREGSGAV